MPCFFRRIALLCGAAIVLAGCSQIEKTLGVSEKKRLEGERVSILQLQSDLVPSADLEARQPGLPEVWANQFWPQNGGYPNHALGHLALGADLEKAWRVSIGAGGDDRTPLTATPIVAEGAVFTLDTDGDVTAFDIATGKKKWRQSIVPRGEEEAGAVGGGLAYASGKLYVTSGYKHLVAVNPSTGSPLWRAAIPSPARSAPTIMDDKVYLITLDNRLMVFEASDGSLLWNYAGVNETTNLLGSASPAADSSIVILPLSSGEIYGLRPENGQVVWQDNLSAVRRTGALSSIADIRGLPVIDQGIVYAVSYSGRMAALDQVTGERLWQREIGSAETPWAAGDAVFVVTAEQQLTALSRQSGAVYWVTPLPRFDNDDREKPVVWAGPTLAGGRLIVVSTGGEMLEVDPGSGKILRGHELSGAAELAPVVASNTLFILTKDGELTAYR